ncbi:zinc finger CCCH domain-containing protein 19-like isoform X2 [Silene latifolia]|uniref:zinc finger CCCH domain-containing protein 19-like isoform X2 n=1 Tax=Silene latifolia TaxID=37657 RepID=UPI003D776015
MSIALGLIGERMRNFDVHEASPGLSIMHQGDASRVVTLVQYLGMPASGRRHDLVCKRTICHEKSRGASSHTSWHFCHQCGKNSNFMCYTCQFSLCKSCSKDAAIFCVRGNKGFCSTCVKTIRVIENSEQNETGNDAFSDKSSWDHLFKGYWLQQKEKLCITFDELSRVKDPCKGSDKQQTPVEVHADNYDAGGDSNNSLANKQVSDSKRKKVKRKSKSLDYATDSSSEKNANSENRKSKKRLKSQAKEVNSDTEQSSPDTGSRRGTKARKLLPSRSKVTNYRSADDFSEDNIEWASKELLEFVMHMKNGDQSVLTQFDVQGLLLEYIKGNKLRDPRRQSQIICDPMLQKLFGKPRVGHFEMLKLLESHFFLKDIPHADSSQGTAADTEMRLSNADNNTDSLLDGGKSRGRKSHKRGEEREAQSNLDDYAAIDMHNINLIFLRRNLLEALMENSETFPDKAAGSFVRIRISGSGQKHDIYRLVQIIGTSESAEPYKVGKRTTDVMLEILNLGKTETIPIDTISSQEFSEDECKRLRQSIKCGLINRMTVGGVLEKAMELHEIRIVDWLEAEMARLSHLRDRASEKGHKKELRECVEKLQLLKTPEERQRRLDEIPKVHADPKMDPSCESEDELDSPKQASDVRPRETGFSRRGKDHFPSREGGSISSDSWSANARPPNQKSDPNRSSSGMDCSGRRETLSFISPTREHTCSNGVDKRLPRSNSQEKSRVASGSSILGGHYGMRSSMSESPSISSFAGQTGLNISETEKIWQYRDPTGKVQGPFSMTQLRKWNSTGYFPNDLRIWRISRSDNDYVLLTDLLAGRLDEEVLVVKNVPTSIDTSKLTGNSHSSGNVGIYDSPSLSSPTPARSTFQSNNQLQRGIERLPSPTPSSPTDLIGVGRSNFVSSVQPAAGQQSFSTSGYRSDLSSSSGAGNSIASKSTLQTVSQPFTMLNSIMKQSTSGQGLSNVIQPGAGQNPAVYTHGWSSGHVARMETVNASMAPNNPNAASVSNQAPSYGMLAHNAGRPASTGMPRGGQQKIANHNMAWSHPSNGSTNSGWVAPPGNTGRQGGDHSRNGGAGGGQWNRQSSFGSRAQRVCKFHENGHCRKGVSCDFMHT